MEFHLTGRLSKCLLLAYRTPADSVRRLLPPGLQLITRGPWAFWNIVACEVERIRPRGLPAFCGITYRHVAYRLYVRVQFAGGSAERGLYFVRSDADSSLVSLAGNLFTDFKFHSSTIDFLDTDGMLVQVQSRDKMGNATLTAKPATHHLLPAGSCFSHAEEREEILKYRPRAFSPDAEGRFVNIATVGRDESLWMERPMAVHDARWKFLEELGQRNLVLERATSVAPIDYRWSVGRKRPLRSDR